jgi:hypothetical protein
MLRPSTIALLLGALFSSSCGADSSASGGTAGSAGSTLVGGASAAAAGAGMGGALAGSLGGDGGGGQNQGGTPSSDSGGAAGAESGPLNELSCLAELIADCPLSGACTYSVVETDAGAEPRTLCFENGTRGRYVEVSTCDNPGNNNNTVEVYRPDGELCFTYTVQTGAGCESASFSWSDAEGTVVARGDQPFSGGLSTSISVT